MHEPPNLGTANDLRRAADGPLRKSFMLAHLYLFDPAHARTEICIYCFYFLLMLMLLRICLDIFTSACLRTYLASVAYLTYIHTTIQTYIHNLSPHHHHQPTQPDQPLILQLFAYQLLALPAYPWYTYPCDCC